MKNILFPIESIARELDSKLLLAGMYVDPEKKIYIGQHDYLYDVSKYMYGGMYLGKNQFSRRSDGTWVNRHSKLKNRGFSVVHLDEEGSVYWGEEKDWESMLNTRLDVNALDKNDYIFTWGSFQKKYFQNVTKVNKENIIVTGHPRFDLYKSKYKKFYREEIKELQNLYGEFILLPTAFSWYNRLMKGRDPTYPESFSKYAGFNPSEPEDLKPHFDIWNYSGKTFVDYIKLIVHLSAEFPQINIIVRPHPDEDNTIYKRSFSSIKNIHVINDKSVVPWILASKLIIGDACSTGVEAYLGDIPVINFQPHFEPKFNIFLSSVVGHQNLTIDDVIKSINSIFSNSNIAQDINPVSENIRAVSLFNNFLDEDAFENVLSGLNKICSLNKKIDNKFDKKLFNLFRIKHKIITFLKAAIRPFFRSKYKEALVYKRSFPGFSTQEIEEKVKIIEEITGKNLNFKLINSKLIILSQKVQ